MVDIERYNSFLERLVRITHEEPYNRNSYLELITEMCKEYRLANLTILLMVETPTKIV